MIDVTQKGYYLANDEQGNLISQHTTYHVALEKVINAGGGSVTQPTVQVKVEKEINNQPSQGEILTINA